MRRGPLVSLNSPVVYTTPSPAGILVGPVSFSVVASCENLPESIEVFPNAIYAELDLTDFRPFVEEQNVSDIA